jgi:uncharacterized protein YbjT (DUF2867 family)
MILVTGATGKVGSEAVRLLAARHLRGRWSVTRPARLTVTSRSSQAISIVRTRSMRP